MNNQIISSYLSQINNLIVEIQEKKNIIQSLIKSNNEKNIRNSQKYQEILNDLSLKENKIKLLMENKYFSYIQFVDFINSNNIKELNGFILNKSGVLVEKNIKRTSFFPYERQVNSSNKEIIYSFNNANVYNELEFSFYNLNGVPITPQNIIIFYDEFEESFYEGFFRFYNRFTSNTFTNNFLFTPKNIKKIKFIFNSEINIENDVCLFYTNEYQSNNNKNYTILEFSNPYKLSNFNIYKNTNEDIPLIFSLSEDNIEYEDITFKNNEGIFSIKNNGPFFIKIESDYENFKSKEISINDVAYSNLSSLVSNDATMTSYNMNISGNINDIEILIPFSSYIQLEKEFKELEININDFITIQDELYYINKNFINFIKEDNGEIKKLKFYDDVSILKKSNKYFNIFINTLTNILYIPSFLNNYKLSLNISFKTSKQQIESKYYTPMIFDISIKG